MVLSSSVCLPSMKNLFYLKVWDRISTSPFVRSFGSFYQIRCSYAASMDLSDPSDEGITDNIYSR